MSTHDYTVRWLVPDDAEQIAALETRVHVSEHRAGGQLIWEQLEATEGDGRNLSLGLYHGGRLVGFGLAFVMSDRREMASFFEAPLPPRLDPSQSTIYIADWVVEPEHRRATKLMSAKFAEIVRHREDLRRLPADAFATTEYADKWCAPNAYFAKLGWKFAGRYPFEDARLGKTLHWLHFERISATAHPKPLPPGESGQEVSLSPLLLVEGGGSGSDAASETTFVQSPEAWDSLRPHWDDLLARTPEVTALQSWEYLRTWYAHFGVIEQSFVIAVMRAGRPVAVAPLQIAAVWEGGRHHRILTNPSATAEAQISRVLAAPNDEAAMSATVDRILASEKSWESIRLDIHASQQAFAQLLQRRLRRRRCPVSARKGFVEHRLDVSVALAADEARLAHRGPIRFEMQRATDLEMLDRYFDLEHYAPDDEAWSGACASSRHMSFYRALVRQHSESLGVHIGILYAGDERAAGLIGFLWRRQFHVVHVTRPEAFAPLRAERVALARLAQWCLTQGSCDSIDISALRSTAMLALATRGSGSTLLRAHNASLSGWLAHLRGRLT